MSILVDRICTEVHLDDHRGSLSGTSRPFSGFRSRPALVLLGDPGSGKTTEFERECEELGGAAQYLKARDFVALHLDSHPEWRNRVLFIDGLDEMRAGGRDSRTPLDQIRYRLDHLRPPGFRISCREADWLGHNDRESLAAVAPGDRKVTVVRLKPLDETSVRKILKTLVEGDVENLIGESQRRGIWPLLENPLTLRLLVDAIKGGGSWPDSRRETFHMACKASASEQNSEHRVAASLPLGDITKAAGHLCALQLLAGLEGYSLHGRHGGPSYWDVDQIDEVPGITRESLRGALATKLFTAEGEGLFRPVHRQVAEFLAGRHLAGLIEEGLPARRVTALMTSPSDGLVVTPLRGLSAWLAAQSVKARGLLIDADPVGVGLYGDIGDFTRADKIHLLRSLADFAAQGPLSGYEPADARDAGDGHYAAWTFRSLVSQDMTDVIGDLINGRGTVSPSDRLVEFLAEILSQAVRNGEDLASLAPGLHTIVRDAERSPWTRGDALDAYLHIAPSGEAKTLALWELLRDIQTSVLPDPYDQLRGTLLRRLYPGELLPAKVWKYAGPRHRKNFFGRFWMFWKAIAEESSGQRVADLLDALHRDAADIVPLLQDAGLKDLPAQLLARVLHLVGDQIGINRLYRWLTVTDPFRFERRHTEDRHVEAIRVWLEARPRTQKELILKWLNGDHADESSTLYPLSFRRILHYSRPPADLGLWLLEQSINHAGTEPRFSQRLLRDAYHTLGDPSISERLTIEVMHNRLKGHPELTEELTRLGRHRADATSFENDWRREVEQRREEEQEKERRQREEWAQFLRSHQEELLNNVFPPPNLQTLAMAYFGRFDDHDQMSPYERVNEFVGGDTRLTDAVMTALRGALWREDVPQMRDIVSLYSQSRRPYLAYPVQASMHIRHEGAEPPDSPQDTQMRRGLAMYYCFPIGRAETRRCVAAWFREKPTLVLDVLHRCAVAAMRNGAESLPGVDELDLLTGHDDLVHKTRLRLLGAFPTRTPNKQLRRFDQLLRKALSYSHNASLKDLADQKLALRTLNVPLRVRWMLVSALLSGGMHTQRLKEYVIADERRVRHLAEFLNDHGRDPVLKGCQDSGLLADLVRMLGPSYSPRARDGLITLEIGTSELISSLIRQLSSMADRDTHDQLASLVDDPRLARWREQVTWAQETQRILHRDASYSHPGIEQVQRTLCNQAPANATDLAALLLDQLESISQDIRGSHTNLWGQFWNVDPYGRPTEARPEDSCRDVLLEALKQRLPPGMDATPEGRYAAAKRSDIRVFYDGLNIPIEIKKNSHRNLWSALRSQLIDQYTNDPRTFGYGIFLVLWFGAGETTRHPDGRQPMSPDDLGRQLRSQLTPDEKRKISVVVVDVTKPGQHFTARGRRNKHTDSR